MLTFIKKLVREKPYSKILLHYIFYLTGFVILKHTVTAKYIIHCPLDDLIPFNSVFIIPYFAWFLLVPSVIGYFMFKSKDEFLDLCFMLFTGMTICLAVYAVVPNGINLRQMVTGHDVWSRMVVMLRKVDTATNVCPSIHVFATLGCLMAVLRSPEFRNRRLVKFLLAVLSVLICVSTVVLKQHSVIDVTCGTALAVVMYYWTYHCDWRRGAVKTPIRALL